MTDLMVTPLLSIVIPVYNVSNYLEECLESVFTQDLSADKFEVIVVDDGSTDGSGLIARKYAESYSNIHVFTQDNSGLSAARNSGFREAKGEFLVFLDSDDIVPTRAYKEMLEIITTSGSDFITGPAYRFRSGKPNPWPFSRNIDLFQENRIGLNLEVAPEFIRDFPAWNKIYRRSFFLSTGVEFPEGRIYEEIATSPIIYHKAQSFDVYSEPAYYWRVTPGGITQTVRPVKALDRLKSLRDIIHYFSEKNITEKLNTEIGFAIVDYNLRWVFLDFPKFDANTQERILIESNAILQSVSFESISRVDLDISHFAKMSKAGELENLRNQLLGIEETSQDKPVEDKLSSIYGEPINRNVFKRQLKHLLVYTLFRPIIFLLPLKKNLAVFSNYWGKKFSISDGPAAIAVALDKENLGYQIVVFSDKKYHKDISQKVSELIHNTKAVKVVKINSFSYFYYIWRAKYLFNDVNFQLGFRGTKLTALKKGQVEVQTTHGIPLKQMGLDSPEAIAVEDRKKFLAKTKRYTHVVSSSPEVAEDFYRAYGVKPKLLKTGLPQNDFLFQTVSHHQLNLLRKKYGLHQDKKIIVYAPTFRNKNGDSFKFLMDILKIHESFGDDYQIALKMHPYNHVHLSQIDFRELTDFASKPNFDPFVKLFGQVRQEDDYVPVVEQDSDFNIFRKKRPARNYNVHADINELMLVADVVITDYSSLMFNYVHLNKPLILFTPDIEHYKSTRGLNYDIESIAPGAVAINNDELINAIQLSKEKEVWKANNILKISEFKHRFLEWENGESSIKILSELGIINN